MCATESDMRFAFPPSGVSMSLDRSNVEIVAHLACLSVSESDVRDYAEQLRSIMEMVDQLQGAQTQGISPMAHPLDAVQRLRPDAVVPEADRETFQSQAPAVENGLYLVPTVIE